MHATLPATWRLPLIPWTFIGHALTLGGLLYIVAIHVRVVPFGVCPSGIVMCDGYSSWHAIADSYAWAQGGSMLDPYRYSPAFLWLVAPLRLLSWDAFQWVWIGLHVGALLWLRAGWMLAIPGLNEDLIRGNTSTFIAVAVVLAVKRWPAAWAFVLLTKVTPAVGMVWHLVRREWTALAVAIGVTLGIVALGWLIEPQLWRDWAASLLTGQSTYEVGSLGPLWLRILIACGLVAYGAWTNRAWLIAPAMVISAPGLWPYVFMLLAAVPRLHSPDDGAVPAGRKG